MTKKIRPRRRRLLLSPPGGAGPFDKRSLAELTHQVDALERRCNRDMDYLDEAVDELRGRRRRWKRLALYAGAALLVAIAAVAGVAQTYEVVQHVRRDVIGDAP